MLEMPTRSLGGLLTAAERAHAEASLAMPPRDRGGWAAEVSNHRWNAPGKNRTCARGLGNRCSIH
jgi:hypothetical protein